MEDKKWTFWNGQKGYWFSTESGAHIFCKEGQTEEDALKDRFDDNKTDGDYKPPFDKGYKLYKTWMGWSKQPSMYDNEGIDIDLLDSDISDILNDANLDENQVKYKLGELAAPDESRADQYQIGLEILRDNKEEYNKAKKEREQRKFEPRAKKADEYLKTMPAIKPNDIESSKSGSNSDGYSISRKQITNQKKYDMYTSNCQRCVMAFYLRMLGYDVEAMPYDGDLNGWFNSYENPSNSKLWEAAPQIAYDLSGGGTGYNSNWSFSGFNIPEGTKFDYHGKEKQWASSQFKEISDIVSKSPNNSVYFCSVTYRGGRSAHVFAIVNDNGTPRFIDPQDNSDASEFFDKNMYALQTGDTSLLRVNDFSLNGDLLNQIVRKAGSAKQEEEEYNERNFKSI